MEKVKLNVEAGKGPGHAAGLVPCLGNQQFT